MPEINFDSTTIEPIGSFDLLPVGKYPVIITKSEYKMTKEKAGRVATQYLSLTLDVVDGEHRGRKLFSSLHINNQNEDAKRIAKRTLSAICAVVGVPRPKLTEELHDKPFVVKVGIRPAKDGYEAQNNILAYENIDGSPVVAPVTNSTATPAAANKMPWARKG